MKSGLEANLHSFFHHKKLIFLQARCFSYFLVHEICMSFLNQILFVAGAKGDKGDLGPVVRHQCSHLIKLWTGHDSPVYRQALLK